MFLYGGSHNYFTPSGKTFNIINFHLVYYAIEYHLMQYKAFSVYNLELHNFVMLTLATELFWH